MYCGVKKDIVSAFVEAGKPLDEDTIADFEEVEEQLRGLKIDLNFVVLAGQCRICNYRETIIVPAIVDLDNMECRNCENMTMQEREDLEWED